MARSFEFRTRRRGLTKSGKPLPFWAILIFAAVGAVLFAVILGSILRRAVDDETYRRLTEGEKSEEQIPDRSGLYRPDLHANPFVLGSPVNFSPEDSVLSISINRADGSFRYTSDLTVYLGKISDNPASLTDSMNALGAAATYISGVYFPEALSAEKESVFEVAVSEEIGLLKEFLRAGGSEILIVTPLNDPDRIVSYLDALRAELPEAPIGVAIPLAAALSEEGWLTVGTVEKHCDFCALDLSGEDPARDVNAVFADADFYLRTHDMRLLLAEDQTEWIAKAEELLLPDVQIRSAE